MKKILLTMLTLLAAGGMWAQTLTVPTVTRTDGQVKEVSVVASRNGVIKIQLETTVAYRDLQFDLTLPDGIGLVTPAGTEVVKDADNMVDEHHVVFYAQDGQTVKFAVVDNVVNLDEETGIGEVTNPENYAQTLVANSVMFEIPITVAEGYTGTKTANVANVIASTEETTGVVSNDIADATFNIRAMLLGDVNDDGVVDMADAQAIIFTFLGETQPIFVEEVGNVADSDDVIDMTDGQEVIFMYLESSGESSAKPVVLTDNDDNELDPE